jgi:hypothetical protein
LVIVIVMFYAIANWYGAWALKREAAMMRAAGWPLTLEEAREPKPKPEEDIFQHPLIVGELNLAEDQQLHSLKTMASSGTLLGFGPRSKWAGKPDLGRLSDARQLAEPPRPNDSEVQVAEDLLEKLRPQSQRFDDLKDAFRRPGVGWGAAAAEQLIPLTNWNQFAADRAKLRLASANTSLAFEDLETMMNLSRSLYRGPYLVCYLVAAISETSLHEVVWEGVKRHAWSDAQLAHFQEFLQACGGPQQFRRVIRGELAFGIHFALTKFEEAREQPNWNGIKDDLWGGVRNWDTDQIEEGFAGSWEALQPSGFARLMARDAFRAFRATADWLVDKPGIRTVEEFKAHPEILADGDSNPVTAQYRRSVEKYFEAEIKRALVITGIALERYRLKYGETPQKLEALVPEFLPEVPKDVYDGQPLRYQVLPDGAPHVWSIWPSGKDEGGMPNRDRTKNTVWTTGQIPGLTDAVYNAR